MTRRQLRQAMRPYLRHPLVTWSQEVNVGAYEVHWPDYDDWIEQG